MKVDSKKVMRRSYVLSGALAGLILSACQSSPTGRKQLALIPDSQMDQMGQQAFAEMKQKEPISRDPAINAYVSCVANAITGALPNKRAWEVVVFEKADTVNAFALPGGKIGVYTGMLKVAKNSAQLAAVVGHEVAHVLAEHGQERASEMLAAQGGLQVASLILAKKGDSRRALLLGALGLGAQVGVLLPHSRDQESEADIVGLDLMAKAGFDPQQAPELWRNMSANGGKQGPEFLSTHPAHGTRIQQLEANIPKAMPLFQQAPNKPDCRMP